MEPKQVTIYTLSCPESGLVRYVGKTTNTLPNRLSGHVNSSKNKFTHRDNWVRSLTRKGLIPKIEILEICDVSAWEQAEMFWISMFRFWGFKLVNSTDGGDGCKGLAQESRDKIAAARRGTKQSEATIAKRVAKNTGKKREPGFGLKSVETWTGRKHSTAAKQKMSDAKKGKPPSPLALEHLRNITDKSKYLVGQYSLEGVFIREFESLAEAAREVGAKPQNLGQHIKGRYRHCKNFLWKRH